MFHHHLAWPAPATAAPRPLRNTQIAGAATRQATSHLHSSKENAMPHSTTAPPVRAHTANPNGKPSEIAVETNGHDVHVTIDTRRYRIRGLEKNLSPHQLRVNILAQRDDLVHMDTFDLFLAKSRVSFIKATASELYCDEQVIKKDVGRLLLELERLQSEQIEAATKPRNTAPQLTDAERTEALALLRDPHLLQRIVADLGRCGMVGEATNKLAGYLAAVSRKLDRPLAVVIQSSSSAGKTSLMDAILGMIPAEEQVRFTGMTGQSLFYLDRQCLKHKILAISEEEGVGPAAYALKLLQSEGELRHACVGKNSSGRMGTQEYHVEGPTQIFLTTTATEIDDELANRCLVLTVDESREQTRAIHERQRLAETREGKQAARAATTIRTLHQNAQRLLRALEVYNPYAPALTFTHDKTRLRRDHAKYLALIKAVALLHQHQRPVLTDESEGESVEYINVTPQDIALANGIAAEVLGRTLDELSPQTRRFLLLTHQFVGERSKEVAVARAEFRFTRRDLREALGWTDFQVRMHLAKLVELEYILVHRGRRGRQFVYELLYDGQGQDGQPFLMGLVDPTQFDKFEHGKRNFEHGKEEFEHEKGEFEHGKGEFEHPLSIQRASVEHGLCAAKNGASTSPDKTLGDTNGKVTRKRVKHP